MASTHISRRVGRSRQYDAARPVGGSPVLARPGFRLSRTVARIRQRATDIVSSTRCLLTPFGSGSRSCHAASTGVARPRESRSGWCAHGDDSRSRITPMKNFTPRATVPGRAEFACTSASALTASQWALAPTVPDVTQQPRPRYPEVSEVQLTAPGAGHSNVNHPKQRRRSV